MATIRQYGTINMLVAGIMDGVFDLSDVADAADIGLGTLHAMDGELIILDGVAHQALADGSVVIAPDDATTPYVTVGHFETPHQFELPVVTGFQALCESLDSRLEDLNRPAMVRINGCFSRIKVRSVRKQSKPYVGLAAVAKDQKIFDFVEVAGSVVGVRFPDYLQSIQVAGWHLHVLSADGTRGGHLLDLTMSSAQVILEAASGFEVRLPDDLAFREADLPVDVHAAVQSAERDPVSSG